MLRQHGSGKKYYHHHNQYHKLLNSKLFVLLLVSYLKWLDIVDQIQLILLMTAFLFFRMIFYLNRITLKDFGLIWIQPMIQPTMN